MGIGKFSGLTSELLSSYIPGQEGIGLSVLAFRQEIGKQQCFVFEAGVKVDPTQYEMIAMANIEGGKITKVENITQEFKNGNKKDERSDSTKLIYGQI